METLLLLVLAFISVSLIIYGSLQISNTKTSIICFSTGYIGFIIFSFICVTNKPNMNTSPKICKCCNHLINP